MQRFGSYEVSIKIEESGELFCLVVLRLSRSRAPSTNGTHLVFILAFSYGILACRVRDLWSDTINNRTLLPGNRRS